jgi:hypothetical protein
MSLQPGREEALDLAAAARLLEPGLYGFALDDDEGRHRQDAEPLDEVGTLLLVHAVELERAVVAPALEYLSQEPFNATAGAGNGRIEEDESRLLGR